MTETGPPPGATLPPETERDTPDWACFVNGDELVLRIGDEHFTIDLKEHFTVDYEAARARFLKALAQLGVDVEKASPR